MKENKNATEVDKIKEMLPKSTSTSLDPIVGKPPAVKFSQDCVVAINNLSDNDFKEIFDHILENYPNDFDAIKSLYSKLNKDKKELVENLNIADSSWDTGFATIFLD